MLTQAQDFRDECDVLARLLEGVAPADWSRPTLFKGWTADDIVVHLHFWNLAADLSERDSEGFQRLWGDVLAALKVETMRVFEGRRVAQRGPELLATWRDYARDMAARWLHLDPSKRVKWAGPDMSVRSSITARQMEHWAHGQALFDLFGKRREESDRLLNIVVLGYNTYGWSFRVHGQEPPSPQPYLSLTLPSGKTWTAGDPGAGSSIRGSAVEFCQVVAQTRNVADTALQVDGDAATRWMQCPQCFAGPPETPPAPGVRRPTVQPAA